MRIMGKVYHEINEKIQSFIAKQHMFFVATAPSSVDGHLNCSPKGLNTFCILSPTQVAYLDYVGSGAETIAHLRENGRIVIMFCAFEGPPTIVRLYGTGEVIEAKEEGFSAMLETMIQTAHADRPLAVPSLGLRSIVTVTIDRVADSCGYSVPRYQYKESRDQLTKWADRKGEEALETYQKEKNKVSIDGLPALRWVQPDTDDS
jgi:hypothetical protein